MQGIFTFPWGVEAYTYGGALRDTRQGVFGHHPVGGIQGYIEEQTRSSGRFTYNVHHHTLIYRSGTYTAYHRLDRLCIHGTYMAYTPSLDTLVRCGHRHCRILSSFLRKKRYHCI